MRQDDYAENDRRFGETRLRINHIRWPGHNEPPRRTPRPRYGFQNYALFPHLNVSENVAFGLRARHRPKPEIRDRVKGALDLVQLPGYEQRRVDELSGGQQQRVAIARAIAIEPALLLFDEPLSNLDVTLREETRGELRELVARLGLTAVYVTRSGGGVRVMRSHQRDGRRANPANRSAARFV